MAFDPSKYGATPVQQQSQFDPSKYGATLANPSLLQRAGSFVGNTLLGAPVNMVNRIGQAAGVGVGAIASKLTGDPGYYDRSVAATDQPTQVPLLPGISTNVRPTSQETPETIGGQGLGTIGYGLPPGFRGAALGAGNAMQNKGSFGDVVLQGTVGALTDIGLTKVGGYLGDIGNRLFPTHGFTNTLVQAGVSPDVASDAAQTLKDLGVNALSSQQDVMRAGNLVDNMADIPIKDTVQTALGQLAKWMSAAPAKSGGLLSKLAIPLTWAGAQLYDKYGKAVGDVAQKALSAGGL